MRSSFAKDRLGLLCEELNKTKSTRKSAYVGTVEEGMRIIDEHIANGARKKDAQFKENIITIASFYDDLKVGDP